MSEDSSELAPHNSNENMLETEESTEVRESKNGVVSELGYKQIYTIKISTYHTLHIIITVKNFIRLLTKSSNRNHLLRK